jgi:hypothetical protein
MAYWGMLRRCCDTRVALVLDGENIKMETISDTVKNRVAANDSNHTKVNKLKDE